MKITLNVINLHEVPIYEQLQIEEALLRNDERNWLLINYGAPKAIVMGISGKPNLLIDSEVYAQNPVPVIRRFSGGGTVFVDSNTLFATFIGDASLLHHPKCYPETILQWGAHHLTPILPDDFQLREHDFALGTKKFGGNALYIRKNRWLLHTSILWDYSPTHMAYLKIPPKAPQYRLGRDHATFLCTLKEHFSSPNDFFEQLRQSLPYILSQAEPSSLAKLLQRPHRRSTTMIPNIFEDREAVSHCIPHIG